MKPEQIFMLINCISGAAWFCIIVLSRFWKRSDFFVSGILVVMISLIYAWLNFAYIGESGGPKGFLSYDGVATIFRNPYLIDAAWAHIIAFDILVGLWIKNNAVKNNIPYWMVVPVLLVTIMFAPLGYVIYLLLRLIRTKGAAQE